jgi:hypothetical protein
MNLWRDFGATVSPDTLHWSTPINFYRDEMAAAIRAAGSERLRMRAGTRLLRPQRDHGIHPRGAAGSDEGGDDQ